MTRTQKQKSVEAALDVYQVGLAIEGDRAAFESLYRRWHPRLLRLARRLTRHPDEALDVLQEAALTIARDIHKLRDPARFSPWAYTIIRRRAADHIGKAVRRREHESALVQDDIDAAEDENLSLRQALLRLSETDRLMLTLFYLDGLRGTEMAAALGIPLGTLKSRLFTARQKLKSIYSPSEGDET